MDAITALAQVLEARELRWAIVGAHAANFYRDDIRSTSDVDVLVSLGAARLRELADVLAEAGWRIRRLYPDDWLLRVVHPNFGAVDVIAAGVEYQETALARAQPKVFPNGGTARVLAVEDVIIHKLIANRAQDEADVVSILATNTAMDEDYLGAWTEFWEIADRYENCLAKASRTS